MRLIARLLAPALLAVLFLLPSVAAAQQTAILDVRSNVEGALVFLDGALVGVTPLLEIVPAGSHALSVTQDSFAPYEQQVNLLPDATLELAVQLARVAPGLRVSVDVDDALVFLDGNQVGAGATVVVDPAPAGQHQLVVESDTFGRWEGSIGLKAGLMTPVEVALRGALGSLAVTSEPAGATVLLDGESVGVTPLRLDAVQPGSHSLRLRLDGHSEALQAVNLKEGDTATVALGLTTEGGTLDIRPTPGDATVFVNGVEIGRGKQLYGPVKPGMYSVRISAANHTDWIGPVQVEADGTGKVVARLEAFDLGNGRLAGGRPVTKQPGFWVGVGAGAAAIVGGVVAAVAVSQSANQPDPPTPTGVLRPTGTIAYTLP